MRKDMLKDKIVLAIISIILIISGLLIALWTYILLDKGINLAMIPKITFFGTAYVLIVLGLIGLIYSLVFFGKKGKKKKTITLEVIKIIPYKKIFKVYFIDINNDTGISEGYYLYKTKKEKQFDKGSLYNLNIYQYGKILVSEDMDDDVVKNEGVQIKDTESLINLYCFKPSDFKNISSK